MNQTFVCCSTYHVYLSIIEAYKFKYEGHDSILIFFVDHIEGIEEFVDNVAKIGVFKKVLKIQGYTLIRNLKQRYGAWRYFTQRASIVVDLYQKSNPELVEYDAFIANSQINLFQINRTRAYFLIKYPENHFRMYEDGYGTYTQKLPAMRHFNRKYITKFPVLKGHDPQIKEVVVSFPEKVVDKVLIPKLKKLNIQALEDGIREEDKCKVITSIIGDVSVMRERATIVITQPISEDGICTENEKKKLYGDIIDAEIESGHMVYLKTHPRERTVYSYEKDGLYNLPKYFPLEVFNLSKNLMIERAVSFYSTALYNLKHVDEKVLLGEDYLQKAIVKLRKR
ncbi:MAG: hypothetical protein IR153_09355 [Flavobacterium sp.]|nr:hypothetical protein [Flavobacterium sp.]